jgi:hypothetical protein
MFLRGCGFGERSSPLTAKPLGRAHRQLSGEGWLALPEAAQTCSAESFVLAEQLRVMYYRFCAWSLFLVRLP